MEERFELLWMDPLGIKKNTTKCTGLCLVAQACLTLCNPMDCRPTGFSIHGISQARILECCHFLLQGYLPDPGIEPGSSALQVYSLWSEPPGKPRVCMPLPKIPHATTKNWHSQINKLNNLFRKRKTEGTLQSSLRRWNLTKDFQEMKFIKRASGGRLMLA